MNPVNKKVLASTYQSGQVPKCTRTYKPFDVIVTSSEIIVNKSDEEEMQRLIAQRAEIDLKIKKIQLKAYGGL